MEDHERTLAEESDNVTPGDIAVAGAAEHDKHGEDVVEEI